MLENENHDGWIRWSREDKVNIFITIVYTYIYISLVPYL